MGALHAEVGVAEVARGVEFAPGRGEGGEQEEELKGLGAAGGWVSERRTSRGWPSVNQRAPTGQVCRWGMTASCRMLRRITAKTILATTGAVRCADASRGYRAQRANVSQPESRFSTF